MTKWEYSTKAVYAADWIRERACLEEMGAEGWELVTVVLEAREMPNMSESRLYFKRKCDGTP